MLITPVSPYNQAKLLRDLASFLNPRMYEGATSNNNKTSISNGSKNRTDAIYQNIDINSESAAITQFSSQTLTQQVNLHLSQSKACKTKMLYQSNTEGKDILLLERMCPWWPTLSPCFLAKYRSLLRKTPAHDIYSGVEGHHGHTLSIIRSQYILMREFTKGGASTQRQNEG